MEGRKTHKLLVVLCEIFVGHLNRKLVQDHVGPVNIGQGGAWWMHNDAEMLWRLAVTNGMGHGIAERLRKGVLI